jgi:hypothetical protein
MVVRAVALSVLILTGSCNRSGGGDTGGPVAPAAGSAAKPGSGGAGFSADLAKEMGGSAGPPVAADPAKPDVVAKADPPKSDPAKPGDPAKPAEPAKAGSAEPAGASAELKDARAGKSGSAPESHPIKVSGELKAIKLSLLPNWDRDVDEPGTFQYVVRIKGTQNTKTFAFRYGYDDPKAPVDRDQYKKFLQDASVMTGEIRDRQRGSAWFLEGNDAKGTPSFRYVVLYGGKRLICYGPLYKDAESNKLGDDRDQTVIQAKQICETLAL